MATRQAPVATPLVVSALQ